jgi:hypothetical protein
MDLEELIQEKKGIVASKTKVPEISINLSESKMKDLLKFINDNMQDLSEIKIVKFGNGLMLRKGNEKAYIRLEKE